MSYPGASTFPGATTYPGASTFPRTGRYLLLSPAVDVATRLAGRGLYATTPHAQSVWRDPDGTWRTGFAPTAAQRDAATWFFQGGYVHEVSGEARDALFEGGFGAYLKEIT